MGKRLERQSQRDWKVKERGKTHWSFSSCLEDVTVTGDTLEPRKGKDRLHVRCILETVFQDCWWGWEKGRVKVSAAWNHCRGSRHTWVLSVCDVYEVPKCASCGHWKINSGSQGANCIGLPWKIVVLNGIIYILGSTGTCPQQQLQDSGERAHVVSCLLLQMWEPEFNLRNSWEKPGMV